MSFEGLLKKGELTKQYRAEVVSHSEEGFTQQLLLSNGLEVKLLDQINPDQLSGCLTFEYNCSNSKTLLNTKSREELDSKIKELEKLGIAYKVETSTENKYQNLRQQITAELCDGPRIKPSHAIKTYYLRVFVMQEKPSKKPIRVWREEELIYQNPFFT